MVTFLQRYPADSRAVNAAYWIGETHYAETSYDKAVLQFEEVVQKYGDDPKVASALFKQALAFDALKDRKSARVVMKKVVDRFPLSEEAKRAKDKLKEWGS
jgi:tol-pal system protein YbgF